MSHRALAAVALFAAGFLSAGQSLAQPKPPTPADNRAIAAAAQVPDDPECLTITQASTSPFTISNTAEGHSRDAS